MTIKIALIDDHKLLLEGLKNQLSSRDDLEVLGAFCEADELLVFLENQKIDILISDMLLKDRHAFELIEQIDSEMKVILISGFYEELLHKRALEYGVYAFLAKEVSSQELLDTIYQVAQGNHILPSRIFEQGNYKLLTETECKIVCYIVREYTNGAIAKELCMSRRTVESHVSSICQKLDVKGRIGIAREAVKLNLH